MRNGSLFQNFLAVKNEIFSSADRAFYKNTQIFSPVRFSLTLFFRIDLYQDNCGTVRAFKINQSTVFILNTVRFALLTFFEEKQKILGKKYGTPRAK
jgi:hypothetical protein